MSISLGGQFANISFYLANKFPFLFLQIFWIIASKNGYLECIEFLIKNGAYVNNKGIDGGTSVMKGI